ncbi:ABC transporter permease [Paracoccus laeviglucosivorans]|uniref:NitT/TauT family transport system permease protein/taurine transport system permease protein n=1 Tax=Paracoccus laeviglucosivorans TaxID=1197861 RepID=A0A521FMQ8_9RHOB|nr:ABC transporter permease [Paracoccus laeviglucosivorans]SMO97477.1 NitT/TauT family transport system permease protein/taurine transport system permease protein [Paracoccus laeviglucosivorans]
MSRKAAVGSATIVAALALWFFATTMTQMISPGRFPSPADTWVAFKQITGVGYANGVLIDHVVRSVVLVTLGFLVAICTGVPLGLLMGWSRKAEALINPVFLVIRPIPPLAWIPLAILWLGLGDMAKILVIWFAAFVPSVINAYTGVRNLDKPLIEAAQMLGTPFSTFVREILLPGASPMIFTGLRLSLQASWTTLVAAELVGAMTGLGRVLNAAQQDLFPGMILVGMIVVTLCGWVMTAALGVIERRALSWNTATRAGD